MPVRESTVRDVSSIMDAKQPATCALGPRSSSPDRVSREYALRMRDFASDLTCSRYMLESAARAVTVPPSCTRRIWDCKGTIQCRERMRRITALFALKLVH